MPAEQGLLPRRQSRKDLFQKYVGLPLQLHDGVRQIGALRALQVAGLADAAHYVAGISSATWLLSSILAEPPVEGSAWPNPADIVLDASLSHPMGAMLPTMGGGREAAEVWQSAAQHVVQKAGVGLKPSVADFMGPLIAAQIQPNAYQAEGTLRLSELPEWAGLAVAAPEDLPGLLRENPPRSPLPIYSTLTLPRSEVESAVDQCPVGGVTELSPLGVGHLEDFLHGLPARSVPPQLLGAEMDNGVPQGQCLRGQDNLVWVLGAASLSFSSGFDAARVREGLEQCVEAPPGASPTHSRGQLAGSVNSEPVEQSRVACAAGPLVLKVNSTEPLARLVDPAVVPNPFRNFGGADSRATVQASDGAGAEARKPYFDGLAQSDVASFSEAAGCETVPMGSFVHPAREVDVVITIDSSSGDSKWPNGLSLQASYELAQNMGLPFPDFPVLEDFRANTRNVRDQATFLGCDQTESPLIVFLPNHATSFASNISSSDLLIPQDIVRPIVQNGYDSMLEDVLCLGCALVHAQNAKACKAAGTALEIIPRTLLENCGADIIRVQTQLRAKHAGGIIGAFLSDTAAGGGPRRRSSRRRKCATSWIWTRARCPPCWTRVRAAASPRPTRTRRPPSSKRSGGRPRRSSCPLPTRTASPARRARRGPPAAARCVCPWNWT